MSEHKYRCKSCGKPFDYFITLVCHNYYAHPESYLGPDRPEGVSGASDCSATRSGADNRAALAAKRPIPPRYAGRNSRGQGAGHLVAGTLDPVVGTPNQKED